MSTQSSLLDIKNALPRTSWSQVIPALRHDEKIWQSLNDQEFRKLAITKIGGRPELWTPIYLALLSLEPDLDPASLHTTPLSEIDPELRVHAIQTYEAHVSDSSPEMTLSDAGLLALALLEHNHMTNSWEKTPNTIHWRTAYACLFSLLKNPDQFLIKLPIPLAVHTILANPLGPEDQVRYLTSISSTHTTKKRLVILRELGPHRPELAAEIAQKLWPIEINSTETSIRDDVYFTSLLPAFNKVQSLTDDFRSNLLLAESQLAVGTFKDGKKSLQLARESAQKIHYTLANQVAQIESWSGDINASKIYWNAAVHNPIMPTEEISILVLDWLDQGYSKEAQALFDNIEDIKKPLGFLALACINKFNGNHKAARKAALKALENAPDLSTTYQLKLAELLLDIRQATEAIHVLEISRNLYPNHKAIIRLTAQAHAAVGAYPQAIQSIHISLALDPDHIGIQRDYALYHELAGLWPVALETRKKIVESQKEPLPKDYHNLASCAIQLGQHQQAQAACAVALEINREDGIAHSLLGEALLGLGDHKEALVNLNQAIQLAPNQALPWLSLANFHNKTNNPDAASDTLRKAIHAVSDQAELHLALGEDYLLAGSHSQALASLRKANQLVVKNSSVEAYHLQSKISLPLTKTLFELGHTDEALHTLENTFPLPENQVELLHLNAQILLFSKQSEKAIPLLAKALLDNPSNSAITIDYSRALLESNHDPSKAISALLALLESEPGNCEALAWLGEALKANGDPTNALIAYRKALGTRLGSDPHWHPRLSVGLAQTALDLDQPETALAALQKDWQTSPQNDLLINQTLAMAYLKANLYEKALQTACLVRDIEPVTLANLIWFANLADQIQAYDDAIKTLNFAIELEKDRAELYFKLGSLHQKVGDIPSAHHAFKKIAEIEQATTQELQATSKQLIDLGYPEDAIVCLKIALRRCLDLQDKQHCPFLILELIDVYQTLEKPADALEAINEYIEQQSKPDPILLGKRAILFYQLGNYDDAYKSLEQALNDYPQSNSLHQAASQIHYATGNLSKAYEHSEKALETISDNETPGSSYKSCAIAADLADACLQSEQANDIIQSISIQQDRFGALSYLCTRSELALASGEEIDAAKAVTVALDLAPNHPRILAIQARLTARHGDLENAHQTLQNALTTWGEDPQQEQNSPAGLLGLSEAALELHEWNTATFLLQEAVDKFPQEPRTHLRLARGLVLRAEFQRLCETLRVVHHAPGTSATADYTYKQFTQAISSAKQIFESVYHETQLDLIDLWHTRGNAIFNPSIENARLLEENSHKVEISGPFLATLRYSQETSKNVKYAVEKLEHRKQDQTPQTSPDDTLLYVEIALTLSEKHPDLALEACQVVIDSSIRQKNPSQPIFFGLWAFIAETADDLETAAFALDKALSHWDNEPRWHHWAAEINQALLLPNYESALDHLIQATSLEPKNGYHHLKLGQIFLQSNNPQAAISPLEEATRLLSNQAKPWMVLAEANNVLGDTAQIFKNAERAAELDPMNIEPLLLLARSALDIGNPDKAFIYCENALKIDSSNPQALLLKSRAQEMVGKLPEALQSFDKAIEIAPQSVSLMLEHAQLTRRASGIHAAVDALEILAIQHPNNPHVLAALAGAQVDNNQLEDAIQTAQKALKVNNKNLEVLLESHLLTTLGRLMRRTGQLDQAINYLGKALQCNQESFDCYIELGRVYQDRRQYSTALDAFQQAIAIEPGNAQAYYFAGQTLKSAKDYAAAEEMLQTAAKLSPNDLAIRRQLGGLVALNLVHNRKENTGLYVE